MNEIEIPKEFQFDETQAKAVDLCCDTDKRIVGVSGQAGTGKTTIMRAVFDKLIEAGYEVALCAPTGKAAKRITEATGIPASTIHRLLEYPHPGERDAKTGKPLRMTEPKRHKYNPLEFDIVLADEYAMVNQEIDRNLVDALPRAGCIRMFGDVNQLRPIEKYPVDRLKPSPFQDKLARFDSVILETIHRQDEFSGIITCGAQILNGRVPRRVEDFDYKITDEPVNALRKYVEQCKEEGIDFSALDNQVISPTNKTWVGTLKLNTMLQTIFRPEMGDWLKLPRHTWIKEAASVRQGDKVLWTENDYNLGIFNGETAIVKEVTEFGELILDFGDREISVPPFVTYINTRGEERSYDPRRSIDLAYCITTHKAQGSEYGNIVYMLNRSSMFIQTRSNFYTGITRARDKVMVISDQGSLQFAVQRVTSLMDDKNKQKRKTQ